MWNIKVMQNFTNPRNLGTLKGANGSGEVKSEDGSAVYKIYVIVENEEVRSIKFKALGSPIVIAIGSALTQIVKGISVEKCLTLVAEDFEQIIGAVDEENLKYIDLALAGLNKALLNYEKNQKI